MVSELEFDVHGKHAVQKKITNLSQESREKKISNYNYNHDIFMLSL